MVRETGSSALLAGENVSEGIVINLSAAVSNLEQGIDAPVNNALRLHLRIFFESVKQLGDIAEPVVARKIGLDAPQIFPLPYYPRDLQKVVANTNYKEDDNRPDDASTGGIFKAENKVEKFAHAVISMK